MQRRMAESTPVAPGAVPARRHQRGAAANTRFEALGAAQDARGRRVERDDLIAPDVETLVSRRKHGQPVRRPLGLAGCCCGLLACGVVVAWIHPADGGEAQDAAPVDHAMTRPARIVPALTGSEHAAAVRQNEVCGRDPRSSGWRRDVPGRRADGRAVGCARARRRRCATAAASSSCSPTSGAPEPACTEATPAARRRPGRHGSTLATGQ
jgi:hypothetical protein